MWTGMRIDFPPEGSSLETMPELPSNLADYVPVCPYYSVDSGADVNSEPLI